MDAYYYRMFLATKVFIKYKLLSTSDSKLILKKI